MVTQLPPPPFRYHRIWGFGCGLLGVQLVLALYTAFLPLLYLRHLDSRALIGLLMGTDNLVALLLIPVVGVWSDRLSSRLGQRVPFIVAALPVAAIAFAGLPLVAGVLWALVATEILFSIALHSYRGPLVALLPDHTPPERRATANGVANLLGATGVLVGFGLLAPLFDRDPRLPFAAGAVVLLAGLPVVLHSAERHPPHTQPLRAPEGSVLAATVVGLRSLGHPARTGDRRILLALLTCYLGLGGVQAMFPIYAVSTLGLTEGEAATVLVAFAGSFLATAVLAGLIASRVGELRTMLAGATLLGVLVLAALPVRSVGLVLSVLAMIGFAWALIDVPSLPVVADLGGRERIGLHVGLFYVFTMSGQMLGPFVLGAAMDLLGDHGMLMGASATYLVAVLLLRGGERALPAEPRALAEGVSAVPSNLAGAVRDLAEPT